MFFKDGKPYYEYPELNLSQMNIKNGKKYY